MAAHARAAHSSGPTAHTRASRTSTRATGTSSVAAGATHTARAAGASMSTRTGHITFLPFLSLTLFYHISKPIREENVTFVRLNFHLAFRMAIVYNG